MDDIAAPAKASRALIEVERAGQRNPKDMAGDRERERERERAREREKE